MQRKPGETLTEFTLRFLAQAMPETFNTKQDAKQMAQAISDLDKHSEKDEQFRNILDCL